MNKTKWKQTHRNRVQTSGYQWGEGNGKRQYRGRGEITIGLYEIMCVKHLKIIKHYRI